MGSVLVTSRCYGRRRVRLAGADGVDDAAGPAYELHRVGVVAVARGVHIAAADPYPDVRAPAARGDQIAGLERAEVDVRERAALRTGRRRDVEAARPPGTRRQARAVEAVGPETGAGVAVRLAHLRLREGGRGPCAAVADRRRPARR